MVSWVDYRCSQLSTIHVCLTSGTRRSQWVQLWGAMATLVLLGVPWVFSAFGAIDARQNRDLELLEGIFQVVHVSHHSVTLRSPRYMYLYAMFFW